MAQIWRAAWIIASALAVSAVGVFVWNRKKRSYTRVGKISNLYFFPVKSLKAINVTGGKCTKFGFQVNGLLDRSFMLIDKERKLVSQREAPSLVFLTQHIDDNILCISAPSGEKMILEIKNSILPEDTIVQCGIFSDTTKGIDCGDEAAAFFQSYLKRDDIRLIRHFPSLPQRECLEKNAFQQKIRKDHPVGYQDLSAFHIVSQASINDLNTKMDEGKISVLNFRPNILVSECSSYAEDSWNYIKFNSGAVLKNLIMTTRCLLTTNNLETGVLSQKEPLVTLRKYRISKDPEIIKKVGSIPCLGINCAVLEEGDIFLGDEIFADVGPQPEMVLK